MAHDNSTVHFTVFDTESVSAPLHLSVFSFLSLSISDPPVLVGLALGLLFSPFCLLHLLLTLYPGLAFVLLAGFPPLDSLNMV